MTETVTLHIDGTAYEVPAGMNLVDAARVYANLEIPIFCYHPKMEPVGMCRMCLVEIGMEQRDRATGDLQLDDDGNPVIRWGWKPETGCTQTVRAGMHVRTTTESVVEARNHVLEFLLSSHPLDCPICDKGGECPLQNLTMRHGPQTSRMVFEDKLKLAKHVPLGELIYLDRERCIQCARCTRFQAELVGDDVLAFHERGRRLQIVTISDPPFDTYFSGNTTDICPVGALTTADFRFGARPWELEDVPSISPHGPVGENIMLSTRLDRDSGGVKVVKRVIPRQNEAVNEIWISDKTRFGHHFSRGENRLRAPLARKRGELAEVTWDAALKAAAKAVKDAGNRVGVVAGPMMSNEDLFALTELAGLIGSRKLGVWPANLGDASPVAEVGLATGSYLSELGAGDAVLVIASDLEEEAPLWFLQAKLAADRGATLVVANSRVSKLDHYATHEARYDFGGAVEALVSLAATARSSDKLNTDFIAERVGDLDDYLEALKGTRQPFKDAAEALASAENLVIVAGNDGLTPDEHTALLQAAANFLVITGHAGRKNNGLVPVWPGANTQGAFDLGFDAESARKLLANVPDVLILAGADVAYDPAWAEALDKAFVISFSLFDDATVAASDIALPVQSFAERDGTFTNALRRAQRFYTAQGPVGEALPAWQAVALLAEKLGGPKPAYSAAQQMKALTEQVTLYKEMTYAALGKTEPQALPIGASPGFYGGTTKIGGGTGIAWSVKAEGGGKLTVATVAMPEALKPGKDELIIAPVRRLYDRAPEFLPSDHLMHARIPQPFVALHMDDAARLEIADGDAVIVRAGGGEIAVTAVVDDYAPPGVALLPLYLSDDALPHVPVVGTIEAAPEPAATADAMSDAEAAPA